MSVEQNIKATQKTYEAYRRGDLPGVLAQFHEEVEWVTPEMAEMPGCGKKRGHAGVLEFLQATREFWEFEVFEPREYIASGDFVAVEGYSRAKARKTGLVAESLWVMVWRFRDGKCTHFREYLDTAALEKASAA